MKHIYIYQKNVDCGEGMLKYFQSYWHKLSINTINITMKDLNDERPNNNNPIQEDRLNNTGQNQNLTQQDVLANQESEEQKMKEKYISEVSKIEDAPGDGGTGSDEGQEINNDGY